MLPASSNTDPASKNTALKTVGERYLSLQDEINFDREKGLIFVSPRLSIQEKNHQSASGVLGKITQKFNAIISRYREWRAKEWLVGFVEKNFEKNNKTRDLLESVKNSGRVSSSKFLEVLVSKDYKIHPSEAKFPMDGSRRARYLIDDEKKIIDKLIADDLKGSGFSGVAITAFLDFFNFSGESWNPESFKDVITFLNQYSDKEQFNASVFQIPALQRKVVEMQKAASDFDAHQTYLSRIKLRKNHDIPAHATGFPQHTRMDLCNFLENSWGLSGVDINQEANSNSLPENSLKISLLRYLKQGTKNPDAIFLEHLRIFPRVLELFPYIYDIPDSEEINNPGMRKIFYQVVDELKQLRTQKKSDIAGEMEIDKEALKISMRKILLNFRENKNTLGVFLFPEFSKYINTLDADLINQENRYSFVAASLVNVEEIARCVKLLDSEKSSFFHLIEKLKIDLS